MSRMINNKNLGIRVYFIYIFLISMSFIFLFPFIWMFLTSFKSSGESIAVPPKFLPSSWLYQNYFELFKVFPFGRFFINSVLTAIFKVFLGILFSSMAGYAFARIKFLGSKLLFSIVMIQFMVPVQIFILPQYKAMVALNQTDTIFALVYPQIISVLGIFLMRQTFKSMPKELGEAAMLDGANEGMIFFKIYLPLAKSALIALSILIILASWKDLLWPLIVNTGADKQTLTTGILLMIGEKARIDNYAIMMAGATIASLPLIIIYFIFQRYILEGVALTGIK